MNRRRIAIIAAFAAALLGIAVPSWAYFSAVATSSISASASSLAAAQTATATPASTTSMTIAVTAKPATGPTPTAYRVDRTSTTTPGQKTDACAFTAALDGTGSCTDTGLSPGTAYSYAIYSQIGTQWVSSGSATVGNTTTTISTPTISSPTSTQKQTVGAGKSVTFNITGTNFAPGVSVSLASGSASVYSITAQSYMNDTTISVTVADSAHDNGTTYQAGLTVTNPDNGTATSLNSISNK